MSTLQRGKYALFDFDGTLAPGDSIIPYLFFLLGKGVVSPLRLLAGGGAGLLAQLFPGRFSHAWAKGVALRFLQGRTQAEMDALALAFFHKRVAPRLYPAALARWRQLQAEGYHLLLVTASPAVYMEAVGRALGAEAVLATPCGLTPDGQRYTGLVGENCRGVEKPLRIAAYLAARHMELDAAASCAYGDSLSDLPMLSLVAHPVCVNPPRALRQALPHAETVHWGRK